MPQGLARVDELVNLAAPGETSTSLLAGGQLASAIDVIDGPGDVSVVTLDIGGNDLLTLLLPGEACYTTQTPEQAQACQVALAERLQAFGVQYASILATLMAALAADPGDEALLVMTYYNHVSGIGAPFEASELLIAQSLLGGDLVVDCATFGNPTTTGLNDVITCVGQVSGVTVVDVYPLFEGKGAVLTHALDPNQLGLPSGDAHPTNSGHAIIASAFRKGYTSTR